MVRQYSEHVSVGMLAVPDSQLLNGTFGGSLRSRNGPGSFGNGPNMVSESTVSSTELSEFFWASPSSGERAQ